MTRRPKAERARAPRASGPRGGTLRLRDDPRALALDVLVRVEAGAFADVLVGETLERTTLDARDAALFARLVYGTETWRGRLDWSLAGLARSPLEGLAAPVRAALRLGAFQLLLLERIPPHAAVDGAVELAKRAAGAGAARLVNAVLRNLVRRGERPLPDPATDPDRHLAVRWSHPEWLVALWRRELGDARTAALLAANDEPAPTVVRVDPRLATPEEAARRLAELGVTARPTAYARFGLVIDGPLAALAQERALRLQGEASQLVVELVAAQEGERVLDLCAAPGGKTGALAQHVGSGRVVAADRSRRGALRIAELPDAREGRVLPLVADAERPPLHATFDAVLVDAPCSGLGTLRAHPEIRWRRRPEDLPRLAKRQRAILAAAAPLVRPGGRLVYATCTIAAAENEDVVRDFLQRHGDFVRADARPFLSPAAAELVDERSALRTSPDVGGLDGFYAVRLERAAARASH